MNICQELKELKKLSLAAPAMKLKTLSCLLVTDCLSADKSNVFNFYNFL